MTFDNILVQLFILFKYGSMSLNNGIVEYIWEDGKLIDWVLYKKCKIVNYNGWHFIVSNNAILTIQTAWYCNARCKFCFNWITFYPKSQQHSVTDYLKKVIDFAQVAEISAVGISWWEPTINAHYLVSLVQYLQWKFKDIILHTNWTNLFMDFHGQYLLDVLISYWVNKLTLSLADYRYENNKKIMNFWWDFHWLTPEQIRYIWWCSDKCSIRFSCFLNKDWIWTEVDIFKYIQFWRENWVNKFIFRAASNSKTPLKYIKNSEFFIFWIENVKDIDEYTPYFLNEWFVEKFSLHKSDIHVHSFVKDNVCVDFEQVSEELDPDGKIRRVIYFPNDIAYTSWIDPMDILFEEDKEKLIDWIIESGEIHQEWNYSPSYDVFIMKNRKLREKKLLESDFQFPVDLHVHTINSDWKKTFLEVLEEAKKYEVSTMCITEHNFVAENYDEMVAQAKSFWINIPFPWIEVNVVTHPDWNTPDRKHHLLCYWKWLLDKNFLEKIRKPLEIKNSFFYDQVKKLQSQWFELPDFDEMLKGITPDWMYETPYKQLMTRSCLAKYLSQITWEEINLVKEKYLSQISEEETYSEYLRAEEIIPLVKELWWICWLAHPWWDRPFWGKSTNVWIDYKHLLGEIWRLKELGLDWIEVYHKTHILETKRILEKAVNEWMLLVVWWSDYHWKPKSRPEFYDIYPWTFWLTEYEYERIYNVFQENEC